MGILIPLFLFGLLTVANKWTTMDPLQIEDGPSWTTAALSAVPATLAIMIADVLQARGDYALSTFVGGLAVGSALGPCYRLEFKPPKAEVRSRWLRTYYGMCSNVLDGAYKSLIVIAVGGVIGWLFNVNASFWTAVALAFYLLLGRINAARQSLFPPDMDGLVFLLGSKMDQVFVHDNRELRVWLRKLGSLAHGRDYDSSTVRDVYKSYVMLVRRKRLLIGGDVLKTAILGTGSVMLWVGTVWAIMRDWRSVSEDQAIDVVGIILGVILRVW